MGNQELLYKDRMPDTEMTRSHYLMTKITNRFDKYGNPSINEHHGSAYKYLNSQSEATTELIKEEDDSLERSGEISPKHADSELPDVSVGTTDNWTQIDQVITLL